MNWNILLQQVVNGISLGGVYALMAVGFGLIFNVLKFSNFSHGGVVTLTAYVGFFLSKYVVANFVVTFLITAAAGGMAAVVIERLVLLSDMLMLRLSGEWRKTGIGHLSQVDLEVIRGRMDELLDVLGYEKVIKGGELTGSMQASWPAPLWKFSPEILDGKLEVKIKNGQLLEIEPGATGRALGLLSLGKLPKRLTLDFSDLFGDGFGFERITGNFVLDDGNAYTNDLLIDGPAAKIEHP